MQDQGQVTLLRCAWFGDEAQELECGKPNQRVERYTGSYGSWPLRDRTRNDIAKNGG